MKEHMLVLMDYKSSDQMVVHGQVLGETIQETTGNTEFNNIQEGDSNGRLLLVLE